LCEQKENFVNKQSNPHAQETPEQALEDIELDKQLKRIKNTLVVLSGKGGVGKSTTAANLALSIALAGYKVGLLDVDFHGPSIPKLMGLENKPIKNDGEKIVPLQFGENLKVMSLGLLLQSNDDAVIWRGPMKMGAIKQLLSSTAWGDLDYLIIDSPPGTGDEPLSVVQLLKQPTGAVIVTQPQDISLSDVRRSIAFCRKVNLPVLGLVENMSGFICPHCGEKSDIFKSGGGEKLAEDLKVPFLGKIPLDPQIVIASDAGEPYVYFYSKTRTAETFAKIVEKLLHITEDKKKENEKPDQADSQTKPSAQSSLRYAVPVAGDQLCMHFGHCEKFVIIDYDSDKKEIKSSEGKTPPPHEPGILPQWLSEQGVEIVLSGGMGNRAKTLFEQKGIKVITGCPAQTPSDLVIQYEQGKLETGDNLCDH
jgi:ATP-binding protein involved in chromosome partitioning